MHGHTKIVTYVKLLLIKSLLSSNAIYSGWNFVTVKTVALSAMLLGFSSARDLVKPNRPKTN